ncbi:GmrSD restriction endonuclease domain-containing protein [Risungbinella massiliensis]|uniref:GmrSD restriction endonuclease domain-containing protein n=1 Tax=Risungbinella massiliensis TaxID=1329796 RepID=UPI0009E2FC24|nr:DUF262 domain-containing protein [Risungbinella massiliensis]
MYLELYPENNRVNLRAKMIQLENKDFKFDPLIDAIQDGSIKIPRFQREFVWSIEESAKLLDSIIKGYPIGSFTLWETKEYLYSIRNIGNDNLPDTKEGHVCQYVLDGQQRITSLYAALQGLQIARGDKIDDFSQIYVDLIAEPTEEIVFTDISERDAGTYISIQNLINGGTIWRRYSEDLDEKLQYYKNRIMNYSFSAIVLKNASLEIATEAFTRLNVGGKQLSVFEIMCAKTYDRATGFDLVEKQEILNKRLEDVGYGELSNSALLQIVSAVLNEGDTRKKTILGLEKQNLIANWDKIISSLEKAIDYIKAQFSVVSYKLIPYNQMLIPYVYFFYIHPERPTEFQRKCLQEFFWRTALTERYSRHNEHLLLQDLKKMQAIASGYQPFYDVELDLTPMFLIEKGKSFTPTKGFSKAIICLFASYNPKSFVDNSTVVLGNTWLTRSTSKNYHHFFPKSYLRRKGYEDKMVNHVLNITMVDDHLNKKVIRDKSPADYIMHFADENLDLENSLKSHLIEDVTEFGVLDNDYDKFINARAEIICRELRKRIYFNE